MNINNIWTVFKREVGAYFNSAIAYIYLIVFLAINNGLFITRYFLIGKADMRPYFENLPLILFIFIPVITMRLWAEDRKENTFELLMTFPMRPVELVLGKFFASLAFYAIALISTAPVPIMLFLTGSPDGGAIASGYIGALLCGALFLAIGIFISGLTKEQIVAFVLTVLSCFIIYFLGTDFFASVIDGWIPGFGTFIMNTLGTASHLTDFFKGVVGFKDILYFAATTGIFIFLNSMFFEGRYRPKSRLIFSAAVVVAVGIAVIFNWLFHDVTWGRFDMTEGRTYTISAASRRILGSLKAPVWVNVYMTPPESMPTAMKTLEQDVVGKLQELRIASNGKMDFKVTHIDAAKLMEQKKDKQEDKSSLEQQLQGKGIMPFQVESIDRDEVGVKLVLSALTIDYKEKNEEVLSRVLPQTLPDLEYLILSRVAKLSLERKPEVAIFSPLKTSNVSPQMRQMLSSLGKEAPQYEDKYQSITSLLQNNGYITQRTPLTKESGIPQETDVLLILNPGPLSERQLYELNKFLYQGGKALVAAQGYEYTYQFRPPGGIDAVPGKLSLDMNKLIGRWGIKINEDVLMDESTDLINISTGQQVGPFALQMPLRLPNQILVRPETMNHKLPLMNRQPAFFYLWGSALDVSEDVVKKSDLKMSVLFTSSGRSWKVTAAGVNGPLSPEQSTFPKGGSSGKFPLGVMLEGQVTNSFKDEGVPPWPSTEEKKDQTQADQAKAPEALAPNPKEDLTPKPCKLIVIGCGQMFIDELIVNAANLSLFANIVDGLALGEDVIQIRTKTQISRDIKKVSDAQKVGLRFMTIILVPALWAAFSAFRLFLRRKEKQFYLMARSQ